jgi:hypothetical protein
VTGCARRERKPRFPKGKKAKHRDPAADGGGAVSFDIDSVMNPELAAERRARQRHQREKDDKQDSTAEVKVFEVRYDVCPASPLVLSPPFTVGSISVLGVILNVFTCFCCSTGCRQLC